MDESESSSNVERPIPNSLQPGANPAVPGTGSRLQGRRQRETEGGGEAGHDT